MKTVIFLTALILAAPAVAHGDTKLIFSGKPIVRVQDAGLGRNASELTTAQAIEFEVLITQDGDNFFWTSRENKRLLRLENENFTTFVAVDGVGYIKIAKPHTIKLLRLQLENYPFTYIEHMTAGLTVYTYFGAGK
jgi:hypothetical protein